MLIAGRYRLGESLGRGGMGEVHRATDEALGRVVAVKTMLRSRTDPSAAERFRREAMAAARLSDPHIVAVYDFGQHDDSFYLVMELVEGRSVAGELAENGPLPWERALAIVKQAAAGLTAAHAQEVVHRDIKPSNLLVTTDGTVKVADFGIAQLPGAEAGELTVTGQILGSPYYLSPERAQGLQAGPEADIYALGCVLYELVTGRPPFMGEHPTAVLYQHVDAEPVPPSQLRPELGGPSEALLLQMLAKDPAQRPTAAQIAAGTWSPPTPLIVDRLTEPLAVAPVPVTPAQTGPRSSTTWLIAAGSALAIAGAITAAVLLQNRGTDLPPTVDVGPRPSSSVTTSTTPDATAPTQSSRPTSAPSTSTTPSTTPSATPTPTPTTSTPTSSPTPSATPTPTPTSSKTPTPTPTPSPTPTNSGTPTPTDTPTP
ncbi:serine/threonine-protein kinase [Kribbella sp. NPDC020789]